MKIHEDFPYQESMYLYVYGKNDLFSQLIILKFLLSEDEFKMLFYELKVCFRKHPVHKEVLRKMGFPTKWEKLGRIKKFTKNRVKIIKKNFGLSTVN